MIGLDTNILVHSVVLQDEDKHRRAQQFLLERIARRDYAISVQVVAEFYRTILRIAPQRLRDAIELVGILIENGVVFHYDAEIAARAAERTPTPKKYWDVLLAETYRWHGIDIIATENESDFKGFIKTINPLR